MDITDNNILDIHLDKMKKDATTAYCRVNLQPKEPSLAVIIKKKKNAYGVGAIYACNMFCPSEIHV